MKTTDLRPSIYAFGVPVPKYVRWPMMVVAGMALGLAIVVPAIILIPPVAVLALAAAGTAFLALKYYFKRKPSRLEPRPHE